LPRCEDDVDYINQFVSRKNATEGELSIPWMQVTNPPIDPIRESVVMTVECFIGPEHNLLATTEEHCCRLYLPQPTLSCEELAAIRDYKDRGYKSKVLDATFPRSEGVDALGKHILRLCEEASQAVRDGYAFLILSDRAVSQERVHIPALMAVGAVHHYLTKNLQRTRVGLISDSGEPREVSP
jgi:glutamate synthase (NADPH) large chain